MSENEKDIAAANTSGGEKETSIIRKSESEKREEKIRMTLVIGGLFLLAGLVVFRLGYVQVIASGDYQKRAKKQYEYKLTVKANRGDILDRHGRRLAATVTAISFAADPAVIENPDEVASLFAEVFQKPKDFYLKKLKEKNRFVWLERQVPISRANLISEAKYYGILEIKEQSRRYENLASQVIGFLDADGNGISGIEKQYQELLSGKDGMTLMQRTATGRAFPAVGAAHHEPKNGGSIMLTIDADIQALVEDELKRGMAASGSFAAIGIVMDVRSGEILAIANEPDFDANLKETYTPENTRNRAVTDVFEPGSTFKIVALSAATEQGVVSSEDKFSGEGGKWRVKDRTITDHEKVGNVTLREAIMKSSNIVSAKVAMKVGAEKFYEMTKKLGFGDKPEAGLLGEIAGNVKPVKNWTGVTLPWMAHGYEVLTSPLQLLSSYATLANDGVRMKPVMIKEIRDETGSVTFSAEPKKVARAMEKETAQKVREYFKAVVDSGTGMAARVQGLPIGGKTGTAQQLTNGSYKAGRYVASFVGYFPQERPEFAVLVMMINPTNGYYGSMAAAPVFSKIASRMLSTTGEDYRERIASEMKHEASKEQYFLDTTRTVVVPNIRGLSMPEAKKMLRAHSLDFSRIGEQNGIVSKQGIAPGKRVALWTKVPLELTGETASLKMPELTGIRASRAIAAAEELGLRVQVSGGDGKVLTQSIRSGQPIAKGASITLTMSN